MQEGIEWKLPKYEQIARDIAQKIARKDYREGQKLSGRSLLAGTYNVSPETIRKSIAILQNIGIVEAVGGSGIIIKSSLLAQDYITEYNERQEIFSIQNHIHTLIRQRKEIDKNLEKALKSLLDISFQRSSLLQQIEEIAIPTASKLIGKSLADANIRNVTGATIITVKRKGEEIVSPGADFILQENDILVIVGTIAAKKKVRSAILSSQA